MLTCLAWLKEHIRNYVHVIIGIDALNQFPMDRSMVDPFRRCDENDDVDDEVDADVDGNKPGPE